MTKFVSIHPRNPQPRLVDQVVQVLRQGGVIGYPTDSCYALGCRIGNKAGMERIRTLRRFGSDHHFTLVCRDLSEIGSFAKVGNSAYRLLKTLTPGPYTFLLTATRQVPRRLQNPKRRTVGLRVPDHPVVQALLEALDEPLMSSSLILPGDDLPLTDPQDISHRLAGQVDLVIDAGSCGVEPTTVVDLFDGVPDIVRMGKGHAEVLKRA